jgi:hypothetical protein
MARDYRQKLEMGLACCRDIEAGYRAPFLIDGGEFLGGPLLPTAMTDWLARRLGWLPRFTDRKTRPSIPGKPR